eukprot:g1706.t1
MSDAVFHRQSLEFSNRNTKWGPFRCVQVQSVKQRTRKRSLVLLSDIFGLENESTFLQAEYFLQKEVADNIYIPDLFLNNPYPLNEQIVAPNAKEEWRNKYAVPYERIVDIALTLTRHLIDKEATESIGLVGYCYGGGRLTEVLSGDDLPVELQTGVAFYGTRINPQNVRNLKVPVLLIFAENDYLVPPQLESKSMIFACAEMDSLSGELRGKIEIFPDREHGFAHHGKEEDKEDSERAMIIATAWLNNHLRTYSIQLVVVAFVSLVELKDLLFLSFDQMYISRNSTVVSLSQLEEETAKSRLSPRAPVSQCAFKKLLKISVKNQTELGYPRIRSFGELSELENLGIEDSESSSIDEEQRAISPLDHDLNTGEREFSKTIVDLMMLALWENCASNGLFRYDVTACSTKTLPGVYGFVAQLNEGRATKKRATEFRIDQVVQPFDEEKFHFGKAFMQEVLFQFDITKASISQSTISEEACTGRSPNLIMINVSPIEYGHILLIPKVLDRLQQIISTDSIQLALQFTASVDNPYFRLGFNSLGAYATINHLHFQGYYLMAPYPVERAVTEPLTDCKIMVNNMIRVSQLVGYPVRGWVFEMIAPVDDCLMPMAEAINEVCAKLQDANVPYNMLISDCGARVFLWPQCYAKKQALGIVPEQILATGINPACFEIAGHVIFKNKDDYQSCTQKEVWSLLSQVTLESVEFNQLSIDCFAPHHGGGD